MGVGARVAEADAELTLCCRVVATLRSTVFWLGQIRPEE
jgi:hypothetical protein